MNLIEMIDALGDHMGEPKAPRPEYIERYVRKVDLNALTPQEREWLRESEQEAL